MATVHPLPVCVARFRNSIGSGTKFERKTVWNSAHRRRDDPGYPPLVRKASNPIDLEILHEHPVGRFAMSQDKALRPGQAWLDIVKSATQEAFAAAFTRGAVLDTSVASTPIVGAVAIRAFFDATRAMYDEIAFVHETRSGTRTHLEWEGKFAGHAIAGTTILSRNAEGEIKSIRLYHRPYEQVVAFSAELARRLAGKVDAEAFPNR